MSNVIQIKRGSGKPDSKLAPYELGIDIDDRQLYFGGILVDDGSGTGAQKYGNAQGIKVAEASIAQIAKEAEKIVDGNGQALTLGTTTTPIYLQDGEFKTCGGSSISGTIEKAEMLATPREIKVDLTVTEFAKFNGQQDIVTGVAGILPISKGGTGATTAAEARVNLGITLANLGGLTADRALISDANGKITQSAVTATELGYLEGVTSNIQTQIDNKGFTLLKKNGDVTSANSFTIENVSSYTGFVFIGYTAGNDATDGWNTIMTPKDFIIGDHGQGTERTRRFVMGNASDSKTFTVNIDTNEKMTVTGGSAIGSGIKENTFYVYGIK